MLHKYHATEHLVGFLIGVLLMGGILGGLSGLMGTSVLFRSDAFGTKENNMTRQQRERVGTSVVNRRARREMRMKNNDRGAVSDVGTTYPMQTNTYAFKGSTRWDVTLNAATLVYERLGISAPLGKPSLENWKIHNWRGLEDQMQYLLLNGLAIYPHSTELGKEGSVIVAGHSSPPTMEAIGSPYEEVLSSLPQSAPGDTITLFDGKGGTYTYRVRKTQIVPSTYTQILLQENSKKELVLFTCYPVGTTRERFVVWADLIENEAVVRK